MRFTYNKLDKARQRSASDADWDDLVRRAEDKASMLLDMRVTERFQGSLSVLHYGESTDFNFFTTSTPEKLDAFTLVNLALNYSINESFKITARGENLTDEDYTQVIGYRTYGSRVFVGLDFRY